MSTKKGQPSTYGHKLTAEERETAVTRYVAGERIVDLAREYGVAAPAIGSLLRVRGISPRSTRPAEAEADWISASEAAAMLGLSRGRITQFMNRGTLARVWPVVREQPNQTIFFRQADVVALADRNKVAKQRFNRIRKQAAWEQLVRRYLAGENTITLSADSGLTHSAISKGLATRGIDRRGYSDAARQYQVDHDAFSEVASEGQAYWLGFLAADGYLQERGQPLVVLVQAEADRSHLLSFRGFVGSSQPVLTYKSPHGPNNYCRLAVNSDRMVTDLKQHGLSQAKTFTVRWPALPADLTPHFFRGFFDGDGSFGIHDNQIDMSLTTNEAFLVGCQSWLVNYCALRPIKIMHRRTCHPDIARLSYRGNLQVYRIYEAMYRDATIYLPRKRLRAACHFARLGML